MIRGESCRMPTFCPNSFRFTHFRKNASATPLVSHTFKTKDLKPFRFTHFQKKGRGWVLLSTLQPHPSNLRSSLSPLDSALTSKRAAKSFTSNTYKKQGGGEGVRLCPNTGHESRATIPRPITSQQSAITSHHHGRLRHALMPSRGKFIAIEGIDGSGKATQLELLS